MLPNPPDPGPALSHLAQWQSRAWLRDCELLDPRERLTDESDLPSSEQSSTDLCCDFLELRATGWQCCWVPGLEELEELLEVGLVKVKSTYRLSSQL